MSRSIRITRRSLQTEKKLQEEYEARLKKLEEDRQAQIKAWEEQQKAQFAVASSVEKVYRAFTVSSFGIWNCDQPLARQGNPVLVKFTDEKGEDMPLNSAFVADKDRNMLVKW